MKKIKHPTRTILLTTLLATLSAFSGCGVYKTLKRKPTPEERWARHLEIKSELARKIIPSSTVTPLHKDKQKD